MPGPQGLESKKEEVSDDALEVVGVSVEANDDVVAPEDLFRVLQQRHEGLLGAVAQLLRAHAHVQTTAPQDGVPTWNNLVVGCGNFEFYAETSLVLILGQSLVLRVRGIPSVPHSSALWDFPTGVGVIRSAVWARRPA